MEIAVSLAQRIYIFALCANGYKDQEPAYIAARWWHLLWLLVPIVGILLFVLAVESAHGETPE